MREVAFADVVEAVLHDELLPAVDAALAPLGELVAAAEGRVREAITVARYGTELAARGGFDGEERRTVVADAVKRGVRQVSRLSERDHDGVRGGRARAHRRHRRRHGAAARPVRRQRPRGDGAHRPRLGAIGGRPAAARLGAAVRGRELGEQAWSLTNQRALLDLKIRSGHLLLDATGIREYLDAWLAAPDHRGLPPVYVRLMAPAPVTERRLFVARQALLDQVMDALSAEPRVPAPTTLLVGPDGAGCTSLLNMVKMQLVGPRVLWLDPSWSSRRDGPVRRSPPSSARPATRRPW
ncbi:MAG: hypothetical protein R3F59_05485 [Myxococcota bacterium]